MRSIVTGRQSLAKLTIKLFTMEKHRHNWDHPLQKLTAEIHITPPSIPLVGDTLWSCLHTSIIVLDHLHTSAYAYQTMDTPSLATLLWYNCWGTINTVLNEKMRLQDDKCCQARNAWWGTLSSGYTASKMLPTIAWKVQPSLLVPDFSVPYQIPVVALNSMLPRKWR